MDYYCVLLDTGNEIFVSDGNENIFSGFVRTEHVVVKAQDKESAIEGVKKVLRAAYDSDLGYNGKGSEKFSDALFWGGDILGCYKLES